ncbi:MAG: 16S rRNA (adenine(1518)-N(6)/adenine(1519)-N(6))-dimethyltransferase RsmA [Metamycoplasmataceae bacterium]
MDKKYFKKQFGQNFLQDSKIIQRIILMANIDNQEVIEIGPGKGALSFELVKVAKHLYAYEIDYNLSDFLKNNILCANFSLKNTDFLKEDLSSFENINIVANIPYNITAPILFKIIENHHHIKSATLMVQKEVAERIIAQKSMNNYSKLAVSISYFYESKILFDVPKESFFPAPKVTSSVIQLIRKNNIDEQIINKELLEFVKKCFAFRRKTLVNNLKIFYDPNLVLSWLKDNHIKEDVRSQDLSPIEILDLYNKLK